MSARTIVRISIVLASVSLAFVHDAAAAGKAEAGKAKAAQVCGACHGADGAKPSAPDQPILAGQHYDYLVKALSDYKSGKRNNAIMKGFAASLSRQDMEDLAAWFSSQKSSLHFQR
jgi:cytochrome c553